MSTLTAWAEADFELGDFLGQGAMGTVFKCWHRGTPGQPFAVKRIDLAKLRMRNNETRIRQRLQREISILQALGRHPNIVGYGSVKITFKCSSSGFYYEDFL